MKLLSGITKSNEPLNLSSLFSRDELNDFYKDVCIEFGIFELFSFEKGLIEENFFVIKKNGDNYEITLTDSGADFFLEMQKTIAFSRARENYIYTEEPTERLKNAIQKYNEKSSKKVDAKCVINDSGKPDIEYIRQLTKDLSELSKKVVSTDTGIQKTLVTKLEDFLRGYDNRIDRRKALPLNYSLETFNTDANKFLEQAFNSCLHEMNENKFTSFNIPIEPSALSSLGTQTLEHIDNIKDTIIQRLLTIGKDTSNILDIKKLNFLLSNTSLVVATLLIAGVVSWNVQKNNGIEEERGEKDTQTRIIPSERLELTIAKNIANEISTELTNFISNHGEIKARTANDYRIEFTNRTLDMLKPHADKYGWSISVSSTPVTDGKFSLEVTLHLEGKNEIRIKRSINIGRSK